MEKRMYQEKQKSWTERKGPVRDRRFTGRRNCNLLISEALQSYDGGKPMELNKLCLDSDEHVCEYENLDSEDQSQPKDQDQEKI